MNRKTYISLMIAFTLMAITFWILKLGFSIQLPYQTFLIISWVIAVEIIHALRRKMVTGKWSLNPFRVRQSFDTIKKCFGPDEQCRDTSQNTKA